MQYAALRIARASGLVLALLGAGAVSAAPRADNAQAKRFFKHGKAAFELGKFATALEAYEKAYELTPLPGFLFNIGQCHRNLGHYENAIFSFSLYLQKNPEAKNRQAVEDLIKRLEAEQESFLAEQRRKEQRMQESAKLEREAESQQRLNEQLARQLITPTNQNARPRPTAPVSSPLYKRWWFWTGISALLIGGAAVGTYFALRPREAAPPPSGFPVVLDFSRLP